jgi:glucose-6-phosphate isomerase
MQDSFYWKQLLEHQKKINLLHMRDLFSDDPNRFSQFSLEYDGLFLDYSRNRIVSETMNLLFRLSIDRNLENSIDQLFSGQYQNLSEKKVALHTALRSPNHQSISLDGRNIATDVSDNLDKIKQLVSDITAGKRLGYDGNHITDIVNIGVGGSHLGSAMAIEALSSYVNLTLNFHFMTASDQQTIQRKLSALNPATTLFIIVSKSFSTKETMNNACLVKVWLSDAAGNTEKIKNQLIAVTAKMEKATIFGIDENNIFPLWDWVGGRFSLCSSVGLIVAIAIGFENFRALLAGTNSMDQHFRETDFSRNIPVILGLLNIWYSNFFGMQSKAIIPYHHYLRLFPTYLQQLFMESQGKSVRQNGEWIDYATGQIVWGGVGPDSQHSFHQLFLQGKQLSCVDFILPLKLQDHFIDEQVIANCLGQSDAMMNGLTQEDILQEFNVSSLSCEEINLTTSHKMIAGNVPSNTILLNQLSPYYLGMLIALYEHSVFVQSVILDINPFDQWGVEHGKVLADKILDDLRSEENLGDSLVSKVKELLFQM